ncbi:hypothetical protein D3C86_1386090 [compost metagenome]
MNQDVGVGERVDNFSGFAEPGQLDGYITGFDDIINLFFEALVITVGVAFQIEQYFLKMHSILFFERKIYAYHMCSPEQFCPKNSKPCIP